MYTRCTQYKNIYKLQVPRTICTQHTRREGMMEQVLLCVCVEEFLHSSKYEGYKYVHTYTKESTHIFIYIYTRTHIVHSTMYIEVLCTST